MTTALVTGISGQDGHYITRLLLDRGVRIVGLTSQRDHVNQVLSEFPGAEIRVIHFDYLEPGAIGRLIAVERPSYIFNCAAKSTGQGMFDAPLEMHRLNGEFVLDILEAIRVIDPSIRFCQASSAEMYGDVDVTPQNERTPFRPKSPYGAAKLYAHNMIGIYRRAFNLNCCSAILYNHESIRRSTAFVTRKITRAAAAISLGIDDSFTLGSLDALRDWGYAPEYAEAMLRMADRPECRDYVIATGKLTSVKQVCEFAFGRVGIDFRKFLVIDAELRRPIETKDVCGDASAILNDLGWASTMSIEAIIFEMVDADRLILQNETHPVQSISRSH